MYKIKKEKWERFAGGYERNIKTGKIRATSKYGKFGVIHEENIKEGNEKLWEEINKQFPKKSLLKRIKLYQDLKL
jgi:hypothetical protein